MMRESQERVEFFHSSSQFGSESDLSSSRYFDFINQIISDTDNIFLTLKRQLVPNYNQTHQDRIQYAIRRAQILSKDTIPQQIIYLNKIQAPNNAKQQIVNCEQKLRTLEGDFQSFKKGSMAYKQFYNLYGKEWGLQQDGFSRKKEAFHIDSDFEEIIKPEYIQINYNIDNQALRATPRLFSSQNSHKSNDKEVAYLKNQIIKLKKAMEKNKRCYDEELLSERIRFEKRVKIYLQNLPQLSQIQKSLKEQIQQSNRELNKLLIQTSKLQKTIQLREKSIEGLQNDNYLLKQQIQGLRKIQNNIEEEDNVNNKSYNSQLNQNVGRQQKKLKRAMQENQILRNQLKGQRERRYQLQSEITQQQKLELQRNRLNIEKKKYQFDELCLKFDKLKILNLQLTHSNRANQKIIQSLKRQIQNLQIKNNKNRQSIQHSPKTLSIPHEPYTTPRRFSKIQIMQYEGIGIEGYPYYETLNRQFKLRFKRACLKQKELLYKSNGIEVGVISTFERPNRINILVHLTNYSQNKYDRVKAKIINANANKIQGQQFDFPFLLQNEQIKMEVSVFITQYPIGPLILILEYHSIKKQEVRILLPAHIFKTMIIQDREQDINSNNSCRHTFVSEKKIVRDINELNQYFNFSKINNEMVKVSLFNEHTHTLFYLDLVRTKESIELTYEHKEGNKHITEYFMKTLTFLLGKEPK